MQRPAGDASNIELPPAEFTPRTEKFHLPRPVWIGIAALLLVPLGILAYYKWELGRTERFARQVTDAGGTIEIDYRLPTSVGKRIDRSSLKDYLGWLKSRIVSVNLAGTEIKDPFLSNLSSVGAVPLLDLTGTHIGDAGLENLKSSHGLEKLILRNTEVTDAGLEHLAKLPSLNYVNLDGTQVKTDAAKQLRERRPKLNVVGR